MQVGSSPLNTVPVNSGGSIQPPGPAPVVAAEAYDWLVQVLIGGTDRTADLMDVPNIDRERGGAGLADFNLLIREGAFHHELWRGQSVLINYISERDGVVSVRRRFTGWIVSPVWNSARRTLLCKCSDRLQKRIDALSIEAINNLAPAYWSADVYAEAAGRSRWEYLQERLETVVASVNSDALGNLVYSTWYAGPVEFEFGHGTTLAGSVEIESAELNSLTNKVEIEADWRFPRLRQKNVGYGWSHPDTGGFSGMQGFCSWYNDTSELPDVDMILSACESSGQTVISAGFQRLPLTMADPCGNGGAWINEYPDLVLSAYVGADLGGRDVGYLRLHAVSKTGRTAILALVTRNTGASFDRRPRAYRFYLASVSGQGEALSISVSQLFGIDEIAPQEAPQPNRGYVKLKSPEAKETSRTPFTRDGEVVADDVTYNLDGDAGFEVTTTQTPFTVPGTYTGERLIMLQVRLDGESPTPIYAKHATTCTVPWPSLQWVTTRERKVREWLHGGRDTLEEALIKLTGSVAVEAQVEFSVGDWTDQVTISAASAVDTEPYAYGTAMPLDAVTNTYSLSGVAGAIQHVVPDLTVQHLGPRLGGSFFWSGSTRQPSFGASVGVVGPVQGTRAYLLSLDMLSNNLLAVSGRIDQGQQSYICAVAAGQVKPYSGPYPAAGLSAFGSYNPVTDAVAIASTPINWI